MLPIGQIGFPMSTFIKSITCYFVTLPVGHFLVANETYKPFRRLDQS